MAMLRPFELCTRAEVLYLLDLVREHPANVRLKYREEPGGHLRILLETDSPELTAYFGYMLDRERTRTREASCESP